MATNTAALKTFAQETRKKLISLISTKMDFILTQDKTDRNLIVIDRRVDHVVQGMNRCEVIVDPFTSTLKRRDFLDLTHAVNAIYYIIALLIHVKFLSVKTFLQTYYSMICLIFPMFSRIWRVSDNKKPDQT